MNNKFLAVNKQYFNYKLKSIDLLIIAQIEEFQRNNCDCYITNEQLSNMFGESESTIKRSLDKLEELNIINRKTSFVTGNGRSNKQRVIKLNNLNKWKVQKDTMEGSNVDDGRFIMNQ